MAKNPTLKKARQYADYLLYQATGGSMGKKPVTEPSEEGDDMTFAEKRGLLDSLIKISALENKDESGEGDESFADILRNMSDGNGKNKSGANNGATQSNPFGGQTYTPAHSSSDS